MQSLHDRPLMGMMGMTPAHLLGVRTTYDYEARTRKNVGNLHPTSPACTLGAIVARRPLQDATKMTPKIWQAMSALAAHAKPTYGRLFYVCLLGSMYQVVVLNREVVRCGYVHTGHEKQGCAHLSRLCTHVD